VTAAGEGPGRVPIPSADRVAPIQRERKRKSRPSSTTLPTVRVTGVGQGCPTPLFGQDACCGEAASVEPCVRRPHGSADAAWTAPHFGCKRNPCAEVRIPEGFHRDHAENVWPHLHEATPLEPTIGAGSRFALVRGLAVVRPGCRTTPFSARARLSDGFQTERRQTVFGGIRREVIPHFDF
jgi:hypothetical protein